MSFITKHTVTVDALRADVDDFGRVRVLRVRTGAVVWDGKINRDDRGIFFDKAKLGADDADDVIGGCNARSLERALAELMP